MYALLGADYSVYPDDKNSIVLLDSSYTKEELNQLISLLRKENKFIVLRMSEDSEFPDLEADYYILWMMDGQIDDYNKIKAAHEIFYLNSDRIALQAFWDRVLKIRPNKLPFLILMNRKIEPLTIPYEFQLLWRKRYETQR